MAARKTSAPKPVVFDIEAADLVRGIHNARLFASSDPYLPAIQAIYLESGSDGLTFAATDRYTLGCTTVPSKAPAFSFLLRGADAGLLLKLFGPKSGRLTLAVEGSTLTVQPAEGVMQAPQVVVTCHAEDGKFPDWRKLINGESASRHVPYEPGAPVGLNARYLARFSRVKPETGGMNTTAMRLHVTSATGLILVKIGDEFTGAQMPVRLADDQRASVAPKSSAA